jgi:hypothetical protein
MRNVEGVLTFLLVTAPPLGESLHLTHSTQIHRWPLRHCAGTRMWMSSGSPKQEQDEVLKLLETSLELSAAAATKLATRCPGCLKRDSRDIAQTLARLSTKCNLAPSQLSYLINTQPSLLDIEENKIERIFTFLESSANFGVTEKRNVALAEPDIFSLDVSKELAPILMAITADSDSQGELVLGANPGISAEALLIVKATLDVAYSGEDEILLGVADD